MVFNDRTAWKEWLYEKGLASEAIGGRDEVVEELKVLECGLNPDDKKSTGLDHDGTSILMGRPNAAENQTKWI